MQSCGKVRMVSCSHVAKSEWCHADAAMVHTVYSQNDIMQYCRKVSCSHVAKSEWCHAVMWQSQNGVLHSWGTVTMESFCSYGA